MFPFARAGLSRRAFLSYATASAAALSLQAEATRRNKIICFIKPFQSLEPVKLAEMAREVGWDGLEVPVRKGGTIEPERAGDELPKLAEALRKSGTELSLIATDIEDANDRVSQRLLMTAHALGITQYRVKHLRYDLSKAIAPQVDRFRATMKDLAALNREIGIQGAVQNHSGASFVGAPVWDLWEMLRDLDPKNLGIYFDIAHATIEGGLSWPLESKLAQPNLVAVSVKDFKWIRGTAGKWDAEWQALGEGMINPNYFKKLKQSEFGGPISMHFEYELGEGEQRLLRLQKDTATLRKWMG